ncbi:hypothetical protein ACLBOM_32680 [Escherichia coli]
MAIGFLRVEGRKDDLYLSSEQMKTCIHGASGAGAAAGR